MLQQRAFNIYVKYEKLLAWRYTEIDENDEVNATNTSDIRIKKALLGNGNLLSLSLTVAYFTIEALMPHNAHIAM